MKEHLPIQVKSLKNSVSEGPGLRKTVFQEEDGVVRRALGCSPCDSTVIRVSSNRLHPAGWVPFLGRH